MTYKILAYKIVYDDNIAKYYIVNNNIGIDVDITIFNNNIKTKMIKCQFNPNTCFYIRNSGNFTLYDMMEFIKKDQVIYKHADIVNIDITDFMSIISYNNTSFINMKNFEL